MVRFASLFNATERTVTFLSGKRYSLDTLCSLGAGELLLSMCEFSEKLAALRLDSEEMSLFTAVVLVSAGKKRRRSSDFCEMAVLFPYKWGEIFLKKIPLCPQIAQASRTLRRWRLCRTN